jgi:LL-diaminopimelate aminotransferase
MIKFNKRYKKFSQPFLFEELYRLERAQRKLGKDVISMAVGDPDIPTNPSIVEFAKRELENSINHKYPNTKGNENLRKEISAWHKRRHNVDFDFEKEISILIGSKEGIAHLPLFLIEKGDYAIIPSPTYPTYRTGVWLSDGLIYDIPLLEENDFLPDFYKIPQKVVDKTKVLFLNYPNNPTGASADLNFWKDLVRWALKNDILIAQDCAYCEIYFDAPTHSIFEINGAKKIAVEFYSSSKTYCMAGWRAGWIIGNSKVVCALNQVKENIDSGQFNAIQNSVAFALKNHELITPPVRQKFKERAQYYYENLKKLSWRPYMPKGSCFIWAKPPIKAKSERAARFILENSSILLAPGIGFGKYGEGYLRFSLTVEDRLIEESINRLKYLDWSKI